MLSLIEDSEKFLKKHYLLSVSIFSIILFVFYPYWLLTACLTALSLLFIRTEYWEEKSKKFKFIFYLGVKNFAADILLFVNINFATFLTCTSFVIIDFFLLGLKKLKNYLKEKS